MVALLPTVPLLLDRWPCPASIAKRAIAGRGSLVSSVRAQLNGSDYGRGPVEIALLEEVEDDREAAADDADGGLGRDPDDQGHTIV